MLLAFSIIFLVIFGSGAPVWRQKYVLYDVKNGEGFNLQKSVYIRVAQLVYGLNENLEECKRCRGESCEMCTEYVIVLPPWCFLAHWSGLSWVNGKAPNQPWKTFFDTENMNLVVPTIEFAEYEKKYGWNVDLVTTAKFWDFVFKDRDPNDNRKKHKLADWKDCFQKREGVRKSKNSLIVDYSGHCGTITATQGGCVANYAYEPAELGELFVKQAGKKWSSLLVKNADNLGIPMRNWWKFREAMVFSPAIRQIADTFVEDTFGGEEFIAFHLRRTDFHRAHPNYVASKNAVRKRMEYLRKTLNVVKIFIMTDAKDEERNELMFDKDVHTFSKQLDHPGKLAMVEQWIGVRAKHFEGTQESRFSFTIWEERDRLEKNEDYKWWMVCKTYEKGDEKCQRKGYNDFQKFKANSKNFLAEYKASRKKAEL